MSMKKFHLNFSGKKAVTAAAVAVSATAGAAVGFELGGLSGNMVASDAKFVTNRVKLNRWMKNPEAVARTRKGLKSIAVSKNPVSGQYVQTNVISGNKSALPKVKLDKYGYAK